MNFKPFHKKLSFAGIAGGLFFLLSDPTVLALIPEPWGMIIGKFLIGSGIGGVMFNMDPKK